MKTEVLAKSSSGEPYRVEFLVEGGQMKVACHCKAGLLQQVCKHKIALLKGDVEMLYDPTHSEELSRIRSSPQFASVMGQLDQYERDLESLETAKALLSKKEKEIKAAFGRGLANGFA